MSRRVPFAVVRQFFSWLGGQELATLASFILLAAGLWAFFEITDEVLEGELQSIDRAVLLALRNSDDVTDPLGPHGLKSWPAMPPPWAVWVCSPSSVWQ